MNVLDSKIDRETLKEAKKIAYIRIISDLIPPGIPTYIRNIRGISSAKSKNFSMGRNTDLSTFETI